MDVGKMGRTTADFTRQNKTTKFKEDMLNDALADALDESDVEKEADNVTSQVLAELGVELDSEMSRLDAPSQAPPAKGGKVATTEEEEAFLDALPDLAIRVVQPGDADDIRSQYLGCRGSLPQPRPRSLQPHPRPGRHDQHLGDRRGRNLGRSSGGGAGRLWTTPTSSNLN